MKSGVFRSVESLRQEWSLVWVRQVCFENSANFWGNIHELLPTPRIVGFPFSPLCHLSTKTIKTPPKKPKIPCSVSPWWDWKGISSHSHIKNTKVGAVRFYFPFPPGSFSRGSSSSFPGNFPFSLSMISVENWIQKP